MSDNQSLRTLDSAYDVIDYFPDDFYVVGKQLGKYCKILTDKMKILPFWGPNYFFTEALKSL